MAEYWKVDTIPMPQQAECELAIPKGARLLGAYGSPSRPELITLYLLCQGDSGETEKRRFISLIPGRYNPIDGAKMKLLNTYDMVTGQRCFVFEIVA